MRAALLIGTNELSLHFLTRVTAGFIVVDLRQFETQTLNTRNVLGNEIMMFDMNEGQFDSGQESRFTTPETGGIDDIFRVDFALFR